MNTKKLFTALLLAGAGLTAHAQTGTLWGTTNNGGTFGNPGGGTIFEYNPATHTYTDWYSFDNTYPSPAGSPGYLLATGLTYCNGLLWGATNYGAASYGGSIFAFDPVAHTMSKKLDLTTTTAGGLLHEMVACNNKLYGLFRGGSSDSGFFFEYDPATNILVHKHTFGAAGIDGWFDPQDYVYASLVVFNNKVYGVTEWGGGSNGAGTVFEYDPATDAYNTKVIFDNAAKGYSPAGGLAVYNNKLYGTTVNGGVYGYGSIYSCDIATGTYSGAANSSFYPGAGYNPAGAMVADGDTLYGGTTWGGNQYDKGALFKYVPATSTYTKLHSFEDVYQDGITNYGSVQVYNHKLYGVTAGGGTHGCGMMYEYDLATGTYTDVYDFAIYNNTGSNPQAVKLVLAPSATAIPATEKTAGVRINPNPARDVVTVSLPNTIATAQLNWYDASGRLLQRNELSRQESQVPLTNLPHGCLVYRIYANKTLLQQGILTKQ